MGDRNWTARELREARETGRLGPAPLLRDLPINELGILRDQMRLVTYERDRPLQLAGSIASSCWLILEGYCKTVIPMPSGNEIIGVLAGPGDLIGAVAPSDRPVGDTIMTVSPVTALTTTSGELRLAAATAIGILDGLLRVLTDREEQRTARILRATASEAEWRVKSAIVDLARRWSTPAANGTRISIPLSQSELGSWLCLSRESVAKVLHDLREEGLVTTGRRELVVHDVETLIESSRYAMTA